MSRIKPSGQDSTIRLQTPPVFEIVNALLAYKWIIIASVVFFAMVSSAYALTTAKWYRSEVLMVTRQGASPGGFGDFASQLGGAASLIGFDIGQSGSPETEALARLQSRAFLESFVSEEQLLPVLFAGQWDGVEEQWTDPDDPPTVEDAYRFITKKLLVVSHDETKGLTRLSMTWTDRGLVAEWVQSLLDRINDEMRRDAHSEAEASIEYLENQLATTNVVEIQQAVGRLLEAQYTQRMLTDVHRDFVFKAIDPPFVPDEDHHVSPKLSMYLVGGVVFGFVFGIFASFAHSLLLQYQSFHNEVSNDERE